MIKAVKRKLSSGSPTKGSSPQHSDGKNCTTAVVVDDASAMMNTTATAAAPSIVHNLMLHQQHQSSPQIHAVSPPSGSWESADNSRMMTDDKLSSPSIEDRRRSSQLLREKTTEEFKLLPLFKNTPNENHAELFEQKLKHCHILYDFTTEDDTEGKQYKRVTLLELIEYINNDQGQNIFLANNYKMMDSIVHMISANIFRSLPKTNDDFDPEEDEPVLEPSWPTLQVVYELLLRFIVSKTVTAKTAKRHNVIDQKFCIKLIEMFDSEDLRERDYLKTILHRIYGKFMSHRAFIRKQISFTFQQFAFETERHNGIGELLEILGSIVNGFALPLKPEHQKFLRTGMIPLHKPRCIALYHQQLSYCVLQYVEKDPQTAIPLILGILNYWSWSHSSKQVMLLNELEEILEVLPPEFAEPIVEPFFEIIAKCINSEHFQVVERTLFLWNNEMLLMNFLTNHQSELALNYIFVPLNKNLQSHWNPTVKSLAQEVADMYQNQNLPLWNRVKEQKERSEADKIQRDSHRTAMWNEIARLSGSGEADDEQEESGGMNNALSASSSSL